MPKILTKNVRSCNSSIIGPFKGLSTADLPTLRNILAYCGLPKVRLHDIKVYNYS